MDSQVSKLQVNNEEANKYITEVIDNCVWRKAITVDGKTYWATKTPGELGEPIKGGSYKFRHMGSYMLLAPQDKAPDHDPDEGKKSIEKANASRVNAFILHFAETLYAYHEGLTPPHKGRHEGAFKTLTEEKASEILGRIITKFVSFQADNGRQIEQKAVRAMLDVKLIASVLFVYLDDFLADLIVDEVLVTDVHGYLDDDFDNPGPEMRSESQMITGGHLSFKNRAHEGTRQRVMRTNMMSVLRPLNRMNITADDTGYESDSSQISQDHCRTSPYYPPCDQECWLRILPETTTTDNTTLCNADVTKADSRGVYQSLAPGCIRILVLHPGSPEATITCDLRSEEILSSNGNDMEISAGAFEALSYTWGDPTPTHIISCNGRDFPVANNLFHALRFLRLPDRPRYIWIDAICINQSDFAEKNEQIRHMYLIYQFASHVVVWLGTHDNSSELAMRSIEYLKSPENREAIVRRDHDPKCIRNLVAILSSLENLFQRPWFERSWIRQEIAAARRVIVKCGNQEVAWSSLKKAGNCTWRLREKIEANMDDSLGGSLLPEVVDKFHASPLRFLKRKLFPGHSLLAETGDLRSIWYYHAGGFLDHLMVSRAFQATNPRDKVYAVLGIADVPIETESSSKDKPEVPTMRVDYAATVSEVYQYTAKYLINRDRNLDVLCILPTHRDQNSTDLPSWTPDWRVSTTSVRLYEHWEYCSHKFGASGFTKTVPQDQDDLGRLIVQGFRLHTVTQLTQLAITSVPHPPEEPTGIAEHFNPKVHLRRLVRTEGGNAMVPSATMIGDTIWILLGCKMPVVLRECESTEKDAEMSYNVVGPSYVPGSFMWGKALVEFEHRDGELERLILR